MGPFSERYSEELSRTRVVSAIPSQKLPTTDYDRSPSHEIGLYDPDHPLLLLVLDSKFHEQFCIWCVTIPHGYNQGVGG